MKRLAVAFALLSLPFLTTPVVARPSHSGYSHHSDSHSTGSHGYRSGGHSSGGGHPYHASSHSTRGGSGVHYAHASSTATHHSMAHGHRSTYSYSAPRDSHGRIERSSSAKHEFEKETGYPHGRPGYVIDHIVPLSEGGSDSPSNMQWQTVADAKAKDKWERGQHPSKKHKHE